MRANIAGIKCNSITNNILSGKSAKFDSFQHSTGHMGVAWTLIEIAALDMRDHNNHNISIQILASLQHYSVIMKLPSIQNDYNRLRICS